MSCYLEQITAERDELAERVRQLEAILRDDHWVPLEWGLTLKEVITVNVLTLKSIAYRQAIWDALYGDRIDGGPDLKNIDVLICKLRRKLARLGLVIETIYGFGYKLDDESRATLSQIKGNRSRSEAAA